MGLVYRCFGRVCIPAPFPEVNSGIGGDLELAVFCLSFRSDRFLRANSNAISRISRVEGVSFSVVVDLPIIWEISSVGIIRCIIIYHGIK